MFGIKKDKKLAITSQDSSTQNDIGAFLKQTRTDKDLTQAELGTILDISPKTISKWENNNGFPDQLYQIPLCNALDITLEELHLGCLNIEKRNKEKKEKRIKFGMFIFIGILLIIIVILGSVLIYYKEFHNPLSLYYVDVTSKYESHCKINGYYIKDRNINMLYIGTISLLKYNINDNDIISVNFIYNDEIIYSTSSLDNISINLDENINPNEILIEVKVNDIKNFKQSYIETFNISIAYTDLYSDKIEYNLNAKALIKELGNMNFNKIDNLTYKKNNSKEEVTFSLRDQSVVINTLGENRFINFKFVSGEISVSLLSEINDEYIMTEKYKYDIFGQNLENYVGYGYSLDTVLKMLKPYITLRNRYLVSTN